MICRNNKRFKISLAVLLCTTSLLVIQLSVYISALEYAANTMEQASQNLSIVIVGDLDGDYEVTTNDEALFKAYFSGFNIPNLDHYASDINNDGFITRKDAMILARYLAGWEGYSLGTDAGQEEGDEF